MAKTTLTVIAFTLLLNRGSARADIPSATTHSTWHPDNAAQDYYIPEAAVGLGGAALAFAASRTFDHEYGWGWSKTDTALELAVVGVTVLDMLQTSWIRAHPERRIYEMNPLMGPAPSQRTVTLYMTGAILGHVVVARLLPKPLRSLWQGGVMGMEIYSVMSNHNIGIGFKMPW